MATIENPTKRALADELLINNLEFGELPIRGDVASATQWCLDNSHTYSSFVKDDVRFSNDGGRLYNFWNTATSEWKNEWGYSPIITEITYS